MKKTFVFFFAVLLVLLGITSASSAGEVTLLDEVFTRGTGTPVTVSKTFPAFSGRATLRLTNESAKDTAIEKVSSTVIKMNGVVLFGPSQFNQNVTSLRKTVAVDHGQNTLSVNLKGKPGSRIRIQITAFDSPGAIFTRGTETVVTSGLIGPSGGVLQASGGPIDGVLLQIPAGVLSSDTTVSLGYNNGQLSSYKGAIHSAVILSIDVPGAYALAQPIIVTVPFNDDGTTVPFPYYINENGTLSPLELVDIDRVAKTFSFATFHASPFTWFFGTTVYAPGPDDIYQTKLLPQNDGFWIKNPVSKMLQKYDPSFGACFGMVAFTDWYYRNKMDTYGDLYPKYHDLINSPWFGGTINPTGQDMIAIRSQMSSWEEQHNWWNPPRDKPNYRPLSDAENYAAIQDAILKSNNAVIRVSNDKGGHAVLAYAFNKLEGTLTVYDPNCPGEASTIEYDGIAFKPYKTCACWTNNDLCFHTGTSFDKIRLYGTGSEPSLDASFEQIFADARNNFHGTADTIINVTSHASGQTVDTKHIVLSGTISSGLIPVTDMTVEVIDSGSPRFYPIKVATDGLFSVDIDLSQGLNHLRFATYGVMYKSIAQLNKPTLVKTYDNMIGIDFTLTANPPPAGYTIVEMPSDSYYCEPSSINDAGQVVGYCYLYDETHAFLYSNGTMTDLGTLGEDSYAFGINNAGQVVGYSYTSSGESHAFLYSNGTMTDLGTLGGDSYALGINDAGQVVGYSYTSSGVYVYHAFLYSNGTMTDLGTLGGRHSYASGINNAGQVVGYSGTSSGAVHAFLYSNGTMTDLGTLGGSKSGALGINNAGQVVGYSYTSSGESHAFLYSNGTMTDLGTLGGRYSYALGINDAGQVVGHSYTSSNESLHAFLYSNGTMTDLGTGAEAIDINNAGQVVIRYFRE